MRAGWPSILGLGWCWLGDDLDPLERAWMRIIADTDLSRYGRNGNPAPLNGLSAYK